MSWNPDLNRHAAEDLENWSYPPNGGRVKLVFLGIIVPLTIAFYCGKAWIHQEAFWPARGNNGIMVKGDTARALAATYFFVATFCHFRWFWGLLPCPRVFNVGIILSMILGLCSFVTALCLLSQ